MTSKRKENHETAPKSLRILLKVWLYLSLTLILSNPRGNQKVMIHKTAMTKSLPHLYLIFHFSAFHPFHIITFLVLYSVCLMTFFLAFCLKSSVVIVDSMTDKEKLAWGERKLQGERAMRETKKSIKEIGGIGRLKGKAADNSDFELEGIQQLSLKSWSSAWDVLIRLFQCFQHNLEVPMFTSDYSNVIAYSGNNICIS